MRHRDINTFDNLEDLVNFLGDENRVGRANTWIAKNYNTSQLIKDLKEILKVKRRLSDGTLNQ